MVLKTGLSIKKWPEFIINIPEGNIFQSPEMYEVYNLTKNYEPILLTANDYNDEVLASLLAVIIKEPYGVFTRLTSRSIISGGPIVKDNDPEILKFILNAYDSLLKKRSIYSQFRNFWNVEKSKSTFHTIGYEYTDHLNIIIDLKKSDEILWKEVHSKRRNEIRRAEKEGTYVQELQRLDEIEESYNILRTVYKNAKLPLAPKQFFLNVYHTLKPQNYIRYFGAFNQNKLIGTMYVLCYKNKLYDWYAGSLREYYNKYPNDIIPWEVIKWGKKNNFEIFDFGGAGKPGIPYGVREYKKKFGGELVNNGRFQKIHKPLVYKVAALGLKARQKFH